MKVSALIGIIAVLVLSCTSCAASTEQQQGSWPSLNEGSIITAGEGWFVIFDKTEIEGDYYFVHCSEKIRLAREVLFHGKRVPSSIAWKKTKVRGYAPWVRVVPDPRTGELLIDKIEYRRMPEPFAASGVWCLPGTAPDPAR